MIAWGAFQIVAAWLQSAAAWLLEWIATLGAVGLLIAGVALLIYSALPMVPYGILAAVVGLSLGFSAAEAYGRRTGVAEERGRWEAGTEAELQRQEAAKAAVQALGDQIAAQVAAKVAGLEPLLKSIKDEAANEDAAPLPPRRPGCPDVYRGLPLGSLRKLDALGR
jgi:hypothetical protein